MYILFPVLPLNKHNVKQILKTVSLTVEDSDLGYTFSIYIDVPDRHLSDPAAAAAHIIETHHSWARIIRGLDNVDQTSVADELIPYTEPPAGE